MELKTVLYKYVIDIAQILMLQCVSSPEQTFSEEGRKKSLGRIQNVKCISLTVQIFYFIAVFFRMAQGVRAKFMFFKSDAGKTIKALYLFSPWE